MIEFVAMSAIIAFISFLGFFSFQPRLDPCSYDRALLFLIVAISLYVVHFAEESTNEPKSELTSICAMDVSC
jgi:hypothetical protein